MVQIHPPLPLDMIKEDIKQLLIPLIEKSGCELWGVEIATQQGKGKVLRIYIDAIQGVNLDDCEKVSKEIDYFFQFEDVFSDFGSFEVSSPGLDRRLFNLQQCKNFVGDVVLLTLFSKVNGQRKIKGALQEVLDSEISVKTEKGELLLDFSNIEKCKLDLDFQLGKKK